MRKLLIADDETGVRSLVRMTLESDAYEILEASDGDEALMLALEHSPERLVIVSDGWDNAPPGLAGEVLRVWRTRLDPDRSTSVVHVNPVYDADGFDVRRLAPSVPTAGIRDAEDLAALVEIAQFAEGRTGLPELQAYLDRRTERFLQGAS